MMKKITDNDVVDMINGRKDPNFLRDGLCSKDVSNIDMSELSIDMFLKLSFNEKTKFSNEQIEKFNPMSILEKAKKIDANVDKTKFNIKSKVAIIDTNIDEKADFITSNVHIKNKEKSGKEESHGMSVLSSFLQVLPNADVTYYCDNKYDTNRDENIKGYIEDIIRQGDIKIISMSSRIKDKNIKDEVEKLLNENNVTIIDSEKFNNDFSYYFRNIDSGECEEDYVVSDKYARIDDVVNQLNIIKEEYNITGNTKADFARFMDCILADERYKDVAEKIRKFEDLFSNPSKFKQEIRKREISDEQKERKEKSQVEVPCAGRTLSTLDGYKYFSTSSTSYSIPYISALFAISKDINPNLDYKEFVQNVRSTSEKIGSRLILSEKDLLKDIEIKKYILDNFTDTTNIQEIGIGAHSKVYKFNSNSKEYVLKSAIVEDNWIVRQDKANNMVQNISKKYNGNINLPNSQIIDEKYIVEEYLGEEFNNEVFSKLDSKKISNLQKEFANFLKYMHEDFQKIEVRESTKKDIIDKLNLNDDLEVFKEYLPDDVIIQLEQSINNFKEYANEKEYQCQIHGDIRAQNLLYNENNNKLSLIDFETAKIGDLYRDFCPRNSFGIPYEFLNGLVDEYNKIANVKIDKHKLADMHRVFNLMEYARCNRGASKAELEEISKYFLSKIEDINKLEYDKEKGFITELKNNVVSDDELKNNSIDYDKIEIKEMDKDKHYR